MKRIQKISCVYIVAILVIGLAAPGVAFLYVSPPMPRSLFIAPLDTVPKDGVPRMFHVYANDRDAWVRNSDRNCGQCFLIRSCDEVTAFLPISSRGTSVSFNAHANVFEEGCFGVQFELNGAVRRERDRGFMSPLQSVPISVRSDGIWLDSLESLRPNIHFGRGEP